MDSRITREVVLIKSGRWHYSGPIDTLYLRSGLAVGELSSLSLHSWVFLFPFHLL